MDLSVNPEEVCKVLEDVRLLLKDVILPRLDQLECEVKLLREVTWPVCQSLKERHTLDDVRNKKRFLQHGVQNEEEALELLRKKWSLQSTQDVRFSGYTNSDEESRRILSQPLGHFRPCPEQDHQMNRSASTQSF
jgi:hypothetical protein